MVLLWYVSIYNYGFIYGIIIVFLCYGVIMEDTKKKLLSLRSKKTGKESIYEKHLKMIIELIKDGARTTEIHEIIKNEDPSIAKKNHSTAYNLLRQFIASARFQALLDFHIPKTNVISKVTTINSNNVENKSTKKEQKRQKNKKEEKAEKEDITPVAKQEGEEVVEKTTIDSLSDEGEKKQTEDDDFFAKKLRQIQAAKNKKEN